MSPQLLPDISMRQLEYLVAVADSPTWAAAADAVGVSASALSQGLAELERRVGVDLFEPAGRRRILRSSAVPVLDHARQVLGLTHDLVEWSDRLRSGRSGRVRLGMIDVAAVVHFPDVIRRFRLDRPEVELTLHVAPSATLLDELRAGVIDLAVCVAPPQSPVGLDLDPLIDEPLLVLAPGSTRIGAPSGWGPWLMFPTGSHTRRRVEDRLTELGAPIRIAAESHQPDVLRQMVALGFGWTVLPPDDARDDDARDDDARDDDERDGVRGAVTVGPEVARRRIVLATRAGSVADPAVGELAARLRR